MNVRGLLGVLALGAGACGPTVSVGHEEQTQGSTSSTKPHGSETDPQLPEPATTTTNPTTNPGSSSTDTSGSTGDAPDGSTGTTGDDDVLDCDRLCEVVVPQGCLDATSCRTECVRVLAEQSSFAHDAFAECVATNPLCFVSPESCIWGKLYGEPFSHRIELVGHDFGELEGRPVYAWLGEPSEPLAVDDAVVAAGTLTFRFDVVVPITASRAVHAFVDVDGDGQCTSGVDFGIYENVPVSGPFDDPLFEHAFSAVDGSKDFICNSIE